MEMYGHIFSTISKYQISTKKIVRRESTCGQTDMSTGHCSFPFTYSLKKDGEIKGKNGGCPEGKQGLTLETTVFSLTSKTGGREDHCPAQFPNYNGEGT